MKNQNNIIYLPFILGILLNIPAFIIFFIMILFRIHYLFFFSKSYLFVLIQLKITDLYPQFNNTALFLAFFIIVIPILFYVFNFHLFKGNRRIPLKSIILFLIIMILEIIYFIFSIQLGLQYQGNNFVICSVLLNLIFICILFFLLLKNYRKSSYLTNLFFNFLLMFWFFWFAFPFFGEMGF